MTDVEMLREYAGFSGTPFEMRAVLLSSADRIEKLEAALRSVLQYRLTDETWVKLGFDPKKIRVEFDAARKALEGKDD